MTDCFGLSGSSDVSAYISQCLEQSKRLKSTEKAKIVLHGSQRVAYFLKYKIKLII